MFHKGGGQKNYLFRSLLLLRRGGRRRYEKLLGFFINHVFVGVFQYDSGTPKHALELKKGQIYFGFCLKELLRFFINHVFVGVFQYDSETPKHALELKKVRFFWDFAQKN